MIYNISIYNINTYFRKSLLCRLDVFTTLTVFQGALPLCRDIERQSGANLHILGSKLGGESIYY